MLKQTGLVLGPSATATYRRGFLSLERGDALLLYTDGIVEATDPRGREFGTENLKEAFARVRERPADEIYGYGDPPAILGALRAKAQALAAEFVTDELTGVVTNGAVRGVLCRGGSIQNGGPRLRRRRLLGAGRSARRSVDSRHPRSPAARARVPPEALEL